MPIEPDAKQAIRERVWDHLQHDGVSSDPHGRIPDFVGAAVAAQQLSVLPAWQRAHVLKVNPDQAQLPVRVRALREGKPYLRLALVRQSASLERNLPARHYSAPTFAVANSAETQSPVSHFAPFCSCEQRVLARVTWT